MTEQKMSHKMLVRRMGRWLKGTKHMSVVVSELTTASAETPDVIGWKGQAHSILIECKASRADFHADKNKCFRRNTEQGMGKLRYFAAPESMLKADEIPDGWGLLEVGKWRVKEVKPANPMVANKRAECTVLMSALRRVEISTAVFVVSEVDDDRN